MAISKIPSAGISNAVNFRNLIINGDMSIAQRSTSSKTVTGSGGLYYHTVDRYGMNIHADFNSKSTMAQNLDSLTPPDYFNNYVGLQIDTATTPSGDVYYNFRQQIEGNNIGNLKFGTSSAKTITISFWVRSTLTGNFSFSLRNAASDRSFVTTYNIATANTWEKKTITIPGDTSGTWTSTNTTGLTVNWGLGNSTGTFSTSTLNSWQGANKTGATTGVDLVATTNAKWYITGIQVEAGTTASDFEFLPFDVNEKRCLRYFEHSYNRGTAPADGIAYGNTITTYQGAVYTSTGMRVLVRFQEPKRTTPSATFYYVTGLSGGTTANRWEFWDGSSWNQSSGTTNAGEIEEKGMDVNISHTGLTVGNSNLIGGGWSVDAEL